MRNIVLSRPRQIYTSSTVNIIVDGNSIYAGSYFGGPGVSQPTWAFTLLGITPPLSSGIVTANVSISGQTIQTMTANHSDVDAAYVAGKTNYLLCGEIINSAMSGRTGPQIIDDITAYNAAIHSVHPDIRIIWATGTPRHQDTTVFGPFTCAQCNNEIISANALLRQNYRSIGCIDVSDVRAIGGPFDIADPTSVDGYINSGLFSTGDGSDSLGVIYVHFTPAGFTAMTNIHATTFSRQKR